MIDYKTPVGKVRLLTADLSEPPLVNDEAVEGYLGLYEEQTPQIALWRAAADILDAMGTSDVLMSRKLRTQDLATDGPAVQAALHKKATQLRTKADEAEAAEGSFFGVVQLDPYSRLEGEEYRL